MRSRHNNSPFCGRKTGEARSLPFSLLAPNQRLTGGCLLHLCAPLRCPAFFVDLTTSAQGERVVGNVLSDAGCCADISTPSNSHGRNQRGVAADERAVADDRL